MNKKQGDQMQFSLEERLEKRNWIHPTHFTSRGIVLQNGVINSSILQEILLSVSKCFHVTEKKQS